MNQMINKYVVSLIKTLGFLFSSTHGFIVYCIMKYIDIYIVYSIREAEDFYLGAFSFTEVINGLIKLFFLSLYI